jgi:hypothetical protein
MTILGLTRTTVTDKIKPFEKRVSGSLPPTLFPSEEHGGNEFSIGIDVSLIRGKQGDTDPTKSGLAKLLNQIQTSFGNDYSNLGDLGDPPFFSSKLYRNLRLPYGIPWELVKEWQTKNPDLYPRIDFYDCYRQKGAKLMMNAKASRRSGLIPYIYHMMNGLTKLKEVPLTDIKSAHLFTKGRNEVTQGYRPTSAQIESLLPTKDVGTQYTIYHSPVSSTSAEHTLVEDLPDTAQNLISFPCELYMTAQEYQNTLYTYINFLQMWVANLSKK